MTSKYILLSMSAYTSRHSADCAFAFEHYMVCGLVVTAPHFALQKVQKQLKRSETAAKDDASPVTVADYGMAALHTR